MNDDLIGFHEQRLNRAVNKHPHYLPYQVDSPVVGGKVLRNLIVLTVHQYRVSTSPTAI